MHLHLKTCIAIRFNVCSDLTNIFPTDLILYTVHICISYAYLFQIHVGQILAQKGNHTIRITRENNRIMSTDIEQQKVIYYEIQLEMELLLTCWKLRSLAVEILGVLCLLGHPSLHPIFKEIMHFYYMTCMATPQHKNPCPGGL